MKYSISEAARIAGVTRKTLYKHIDKKPISTEQDENGRPVIDASELMRVYGDQCRFNHENDNKESVSSKQVSTDVSIPDSIEMAVTRKELEMLKTQMATERDGFEEQIDYLRKKLDEATSESRKLTALITDQSSKSEADNGWQKSLKALEDRIANQEAAVQEKIALEAEKTAKEAKEKEELKAQLEEKERILAEKEEALALEKKKSFVHKLLGR